MATETEPSVPFLKPIGKAEPEASSRCNWDSVVLAPMAPQVIRSAMNWGLRARQPTLYRLRRAESESHVGTSGASADMNRCNGIVPLE
jgi:hypothetical protein